MTNEIITIAEYDPKWPALFSEEKKQVLDSIGKNIHRIEHIGSTAVPGLGAKPIIDILVVLNGLDRVKECIPRLQTNGYEYLGENGIPGRSFFTKKNSGTGGRTHHLHLVVKGSPIIEKHIAFRDYLRDHPKTAKEYQDLKNRLARRFGADRDGYSNAKNDFITSVLAKVIDAGRIET
jgi:GrpB-like predicted nucleotidyltransferase (UPF0157 family)